MGGSWKALDPGWEERIKARIREREVLLELSAEDDLLGEKLFLEQN